MTSQYHGVADEKTGSVKKDLLFTLTQAAHHKEFTLTNDRSFIYIRKIILSPTFDWVKPDEWSAKLVQEGLYMKATITTQKGSIFSQPYALSGFNSPHLFQPVFTLSQPILIPKSLVPDDLYAVDYPLTVAVELLGSADQFSFDVQVVYDEG